MNTKDQLESIIKEVSYHSNISVDNLKSHSKRRNFVKYRYIAMYLCRMFTKATFDEIALIFNGRDKSTVFHACKTVEIDEEFKEVYDIVRRKFE